MNQNSRRGASKSTIANLVEKRVVKGLKKKARAGDLNSSTGIDGPYEGPENTELTADTTTLSPVEATGTIVAWLERQAAPARGDGSNLEGVALGSPETVYGAASSQT